MNIHVRDHFEEPSTLPFTKLGTDWFGASFDPPVEFSFGIDASTFLFVARRTRAARCHPDSILGEFQAELWKHDVSEFFLRDPVTGHYLEFNLAPNGGWWSCEFGGPLQRIHADDRAIPGVSISAKSDAAGWLSSASIPLPWLREHFHFGPDSTLNATFILESPAQRFLTASPLGSGDPAFHQPSEFPRVSLISS